MENSSDGRQGIETQLEKFSHEAGEKIGNFASSLGNSTVDGMTSGRDYIKENPVKSIAIAAGVGVAVGALLTLILRRRD